MHSTKENISPKKATEYLKLNLANRPLSRKYAEQLAAAMRNSEWKLNGDVIRFARLPNGGEVLIDGQHRLMACILANCSFETYITRELPPEAFDTIDQGKRRSVGDIYARSGEKSYVHLASAIHQLRRLLEGYADRNPPRMRPAEAQALLSEHPDIRECLTSIRGRHMIARLTSTGMATSLLYLMAKKDKELAELFWKSLDTGEDLRATDPIYRLRENLVSSMNSRTRKLQPIAQCALIIKAWNMVREKRTCKSLQWKPEESFPEIQ